jgi:DnaK suppressor protein
MLPPEAPGRTSGWMQVTKAGYNRPFSVGPVSREGTAAAPVGWPRTGKQRHDDPEVSMAAKQATATAAAAKRSPKVLTDEDLLKASDKDYMNEAQLAFFRQRLVQLRDQLLQNADDTGEHLRENEITTDPSDRATLEEEYTLELRTRDRERKLLKKVEKSIRMIDEGSYGYCEETGEPIGIPRLLARPTATLSLEAQERRERVQKLYGD